MLKTEEIKEFLKTTPAQHLAVLYSPEMEVQVNVAKDHGTKVSGEYLGRRWTAWSDGKETWKSFRIPWNADSDPQYEDRELRFDLAAHVEAIGMTGWNWARKESLFCGYDFDSIVNHKEGLSQDDLSDLVSKVSQIPWITLLKSTSGKGYHIYLHFEQPIPTDTHTEHAAVARSLLGVLTMETGFNFQSNVDVCGGVLWCYHRKQEGTDGLTLVKSGSPFPNSLVPANWPDHINVTTKKVKRVKTDKMGSGFNELVASQSFITLDSEHYRLLKWFTTNAERDHWWDTDHNMLVCHTLDLAKAHSALALKGIFFTNTTGSSSQNCFAFPNFDGSWTVRRHGVGTKEHISWVTDASGWTRCVFNAPAEIESAARANKGVRNAKGEYIFNDHLQGTLAIQSMGIKFELPDELKNHGIRIMTIKAKSEILLVSVERRPSDVSVPEGWLSPKADKYEIVLDLPKVKRELTAPDALIRHTISQGVESGWYIYTKGKWILQNKGNVTTVLVGQELHDRNEIEVMMGKSILSPWELVNIPFADEYPGDRQWNKEAASFRCKPLEGDCDTWLEIINHCGKNLNDSVEADEWCKANGIKKGGEYLLSWLASLVQKPLQPLPYLFFVGEQNTGKSTLHEALGQFILGRGYSRADQALVNPSGFNNEIANAVLCVVEETDLRQNKEAANRIKDWVTGKTISIRALYKNAYDSVNTTHWIQCANDSNYCPVINGDTRIVVIRVDKPTKEIGKDTLFSLLEKEASCFLNLLFSIELPDSLGRLAIPCLTTYEKQELEINSKNELEKFIDERCYIVAGSSTDYSEFFAAFLSWLPPDQRGYWSEHQVSRKFPRKGILCKGKFGRDNKTIYGNLSMKEVEPRDFIYKINTANGRVVEWKQ